MNDSPSRSDSTPPDMLVVPLATLADTDALGAALADSAPWSDGPGLGLNLRGNLGAGKTTLAQALLRGLGVTGAIPSPSYALVEPYDTARGRILHVDLYRLRDAAELEELGLREEWSEAALRLVEWPERGGRALPGCDLDVELAWGAGVTTASPATATIRTARLSAPTARGRAWLHRYTVLPQKSAPGS